MHVQLHPNTNSFKTKRIKQVSVNLNSEINEDNYINNITYTKTKIAKQAK